ncbi:PAS domain-containing protein [Nocardioides sp. Soil805]|uniref:PAS domain-containing protein n=1 Tax=Nocardioides sp. Soil805 TaxID=1736416 RepID=UPI0007038A54|nr:PAS domain-containing protein [Nocardioides sp. Soil805]KRF30586.1 hypothetical protein ASG94_18830 [Nocardioides sp. Soil805]
MSAPGTPPDTEVAVLDASGTVVSVNDAWERFARENGGDPSLTGVGTSFLAVCDAAGDDPVAVLAASAVRAALAGKLPASLSMVIPCHTPDDQRWFDMLVAPRLDEERRPVGATLELTHRSAPVDVPHDVTAPVTGDDILVREHLRISAELHARIVGRLFGLAMDVHALAAQVGDERTRWRLMSVVEGVDDVIVALRRTVFDLTQAPVPDLTVRNRLSQALDQAAADSGLETTLQVRGTSRRLSDRHVVDVVSVVLDGVTRALQGAATAVTVRVSVEEDEIVVEVTHEAPGEREGGADRTSRVVRVAAPRPHVRP